MINKIKHLVAHIAELVDISDFLKEYCKYNDYTEEETRKMIEENSKIELYNYSSNPVLPDSVFDGRLDNRDATKLDNEYNYVINKNDSSDKILIKREEFDFNTYDTTQYYSDKEYPITYFDKDESRKVISMSPIELLQTGQAYSDNIKRMLFGGDTKVRLVSMRIYDEKIADIDSNYVVGNEWESEYMNIMNRTTDKLSEYGNDYNAFYNTQTGKIVDYEGADNNE